MYFSLYRENAVGTWELGTEKENTMEKTSKFYISINKLFQLANKFESTIPETDEEWDSLLDDIRKVYATGTRFEKDLIVAFTHEKFREYEERKEEHEKRTLGTATC